MEVSGMKTKLKSAFFRSNVLLCEFVNKNHITKDNIQAIKEVDGSFVLFYWEITE